MRIVSDHGKVLSLPVRITQRLEDEGMIEPHDEPQDGGVFHYFICEQDDVPVDDNRGQELWGRLWKRVRQIYLEEGNA